MLTPEEIKQNTLLAELSEEQLGAIVKLIENNENIVIADKTRSFWDGIDKDILTATGKTKPPSVKSFDFLKDTLKENQTTAQTSIEKAKELQENIKSLEQKIKENTGDDALKTKLSDQESLIEKLRRDVEAKELEKVEAIKEAQSENIDLRFNNVFANALQGKNFNPNIPEVSIEATIRSAKDQVKGLGKPEWTQDGKTIFRDANGEVITNPKNLQNPLTAQERYLEILAPIIDNGRQQTGGGSSTNNGKENYSLGEFKTQTEAIEQINKHLAAKGLAKGTQAYTEETKTIWAETKAATLPVQ